MAARQSDFATAQGYYEQSLALFRTIGDQLGVGTALSYSVALALEQGASDLLPMLQEGMALSLKIGLKSVLLEILVTVGRWAALQHAIESARLAGLIEGHPSINMSVREPLSKLQRELEALLPAVELAQYKAEGAALDLETTAREWLARLDAAAKQAK